MADALGISPSYLTLVEGNQRPLTATLLLRLGDAFDVDPRQLAAVEPGGGIEALRRRLADTLFADLGIDRARIDDWLAAAPETADAFARAYDRSSSDQPTIADAITPVRREIERWRNHYPDLEALAETVSDELRLGSGDLYSAIAARLRTKHQLSIRILPVDVLPATLRRLDLHARQLQLSELLDPASRTFAAAVQLAQIEAKDEIEALVKGGAFAAHGSDRVSERLFRRHLHSQFAAALMMPYDRFLRACEATGYDIELLQRRFGAGFEQVAHRLTTLSRTGSRGLPFFMLRIDRAGQVSKRYAGASASPLAEAEGRCPLWDLHAAFDRPGRLVRQLVELEDGSRWFTQARTVSPQGGRIGQIRAQFAIGLGVDARLAEPLAVAQGIDLRGSAMPIGLGCRHCSRPDCPQRAAPPVARVLTFNERERGLSPFTFVAD